MKELGLDRVPAGTAAVDATFLACVATILELSASDLAGLGPVEDAAHSALLTRWLGARGVGLVPLAHPDTFSWPGPWIAMIRTRGNRHASASPRAVVMFGVPSGIVFDPLSPEAGPDDDSIEFLEGFVVAAGDIALALPPVPPAPPGTGTVVSIHVAPAAGDPVRTLERARALAGRGLEGDRHVAGRGTFPSGVPGSALTLIDEAVCRSLELTADEHRRNVVTAGIDLNALVGHDFQVGSLRCRGMRLCEPCTVMQRYAGRPVLRALVHRGGLRADILQDGELAVGDPVRAGAD